MKKLFFLLVVVASLACSSFAVAAKVDLQPRNAYYVEKNDTVYSQQPGLYVVIQNNGPDDFNGSFMIMTYTNSTNSGNFAKAVSVFIGSGCIWTAKLSSLKIDAYCIQVDFGNDVAETNENNNSLYFTLGEPQIKIISPWSGLIARDYRDTLSVLPGEFFYEQFALSELNNQKAIIGFDFKSYAIGLSEAQDYYFGVSSNLPDSTNLRGGSYTFQSGSWENGDNAYCQWMANSSSAALNNFWLGDYEGVAKQMAVGSIAQISMSVVYATNNLEKNEDYVLKTIKVIDRIRGDVNDDGIVDQKDLDILIDVIDHGLYNPYMFHADMYQERGINYGAGIILFDMPDFLSNCLLNIWLHDQNDPLVQGLGIGELMSETALRTKSASVRSIPNTYSVSHGELAINAPEANLYNVTATLKSGKLFQATGKMGEKVIVPSDAKNLRVETVKLQGNLTTLSPNLSSKNAVSVYPNPFTEYVNVIGLDGETIRIINMNGQVIYSTVSSNETELRIDANSWPKGVYLVNLISRSGNTKNIKIVK